LQGGIHINRSMAIPLIVMIITGVAFAGCLGVKTPPVSRPPAPAIFLDYHRTGGLAGFDDRLVIFDNGAAVVSTKAGNREIVLNSTEISRISNLFTESQFSMLQVNYPAPRGGNDLIHYSVSFHGKTVMTEDTAIPPSLLPVIDDLNAIVKNAEIT
jgi:hypothetical protein